MPNYDYLCGACGPFTTNRPMSEYEAPQPCPDCNAESPRAILRAPMMAGVQGEAANPNAPAAAPSHMSGCGCCGPMRMSIPEGMRTPA